MTSKHAEVGPSAAKMWMQCPASITKSRGIPRTSNKFAREGSAAHQVCEYLLAEQPVPDVIEIEGEEIVVDDDMIAHAAAYARLVEVLRHDTPHWGVESRVSLDWLFKPVNIDVPVFGTCDFYAYDEKSKTLYVVDFKYGRGVTVDAAGNPQARIYSLGLLDKLKNYEVEWIRIVIVQPRGAGDPIRHEDITKQELMEWAQEELIPAVRRIGNGDEREEPGDGSGCRWCARNATCAALYETVLDATRDAFSEPSQTPSSQSLEVSSSPQDPRLQLTNDELALILDKADVIETWVKEVRAEALRRMDLGQSIPGFKLVPKRALRKWSNADAVLDHFVGVMGADALEPPTVLSPAKMEKALKKFGADPKMIDPFVTRESSGVTLAREADQRPQVSSSAALLFSDTTH